ncbi:MULTISPECIES: hypothetical protein [unclassified Thalassospira]|jgi:hypothetical protein|uniref:hypothetical protein n=1 Tax=unclassified Thalassospira TaxID=2648997 RepID=UPI001B090F4E|nr:hypothetical protein [Thalassospira sp.]MBO6771729.1 hypothetical protein [Thalassospira sp.]MBR9902104.1 hypothetical protein [Rhodospirillales bacterium]
MISQKLSNITAALRKMANHSSGSLKLDHATTDILLTNLQELSDSLGSYEHSAGPIPVGETSLHAIERAVARGQVINLADRRTAEILRRDLPPDGGGSVA